jgi:hypothetical protein
MISGREIKIVFRGIIENPSKKQVVPDINLSYTSEKRVGW